ncbi:hypothetical protein EZ428_13945 [Pedobacter frigiditerrae]|uniref:Peptidase family M23 n=1 Tax=Pedobacter frigiditerrae TaxID=2530452 RepID=A0A4R0MU83_9SPHI|nr:hypothetical protein [Pedobacter frigiditerrae]TCC90373.1 hypothetical protein EZ428_13945 [Pedobacter frigiditerrae]
MKSPLTLLLIILLVQTISFAQEAVLKVASKYNDNRSVTLSYEKEDPGTYTLVIDFKQLTNTMGAMQQSFTLTGSSGSFLTLTPSNKEQNVGFSYSYRYIRGKLKPKISTDFLYLLPYKQGVELKAAEVGFVGAMYFGSTTPEDWKVYRFYTKDEDTVTAIRKGTVVSVKDLYDTDATLGVSFTSKTNEVIIEHSDGTLATYRGFKKGSINIKIGQTVFPATMLGLNAKSGSNDMFNISLLLTYLKSNDFESSKNQNLKNSKSLYGFVTPHFYTLENGNLILENNKFYTSAIKPEIVQLEMTKKEIKNVGVK